MSFFPVLEGEPGFPPEARELVALAEKMSSLGLLPVFPEQQEGLMEIARRQVESLAIGHRLTQAEGEAMSVEQSEAFRIAICAQGVWLSELGEEWVGPSDLESVGEGITFSREERPRLSPAVVEILSGTGLISRTGMARQPVVAMPLREPWWLV